MVRGDLDWIVMKALEKDRARRYETANGLAMDVKRHLSNEQVAARPPTVGYRLGRLIRRNKLAFAAGGAVAAAILIGLAVSVWQATVASQAKREAVAALGELRATAPAFVEQARSLAAKEKFDEAIEKLDYAVKLRPDSAEYLVAKGDLLQCQRKLAEAALVYRQALRLKPGFLRASTSADLCDELLAAPLSAQGVLTRESLAKLHLFMQRQQRPAAELMPVARLLGEEKHLVVEYWLARLKDLPISSELPLGKRLSLLEDGLLSLDLSGTKIEELGLLAGMPLGVLDLASCHQIRSFAPLHEFGSLSSLRLRDTRITDLSPLSGLHLEYLDLDGTPVFDITAVRGMKLKRLALRDTRVADLSPLAGMPLIQIDCTGIPATDYSPLAGAPLEVGFFQNSPLRDLSFLRNAPVRELVLRGSLEVRGFAVLAGLKSLNLLILPNNYRMLPDEDLAAIEELRNHPSLRNIDTAETRPGPWLSTSARSKEEFWRIWDRDQMLISALRNSRCDFKLTPLQEGTYKLVVEDERFSDLSILKGAPIQELYIKGSSVSDLRPLAGIAVTELDICETPVADLTPLRDPILSASLKTLRVWRIPATDFSPLAACKKLVFLDASSTALADLAVIRSRELRKLHMSDTKVTDISALAGLPLTKITMSSTAVTDISPLLQCPALTEIVLPAGARDVAALRVLPTLAKLSFREVFGGEAEQSTAEFWQEYLNGGITSEAVPILAEEAAKGPRRTDLAQRTFLKIAALQAWFGRTEEHAATCQQVIKAAEGPFISDSADERAAKGWCLRPSNDDATLQRVLALAREAARIGANSGQAPWRLQTLGMAEFRAGNDAEAQAAFLQAEELAGSGWDPNLRPFVQSPARFFRAMILFRKGKKEEARTLFREAESTMPPLPENVDRVVPANVTQDELLCWLAAKEAGILLNLPVLNRERSALGPAALPSK